MKFVIIFFYTDNVCIFTNDNSLEASHTPEFLHDSLKKEKKSLEQNKDSITKFISFISLVFFFQIVSFRLVCLVRVGDEK